MSMPIPVKCKLHDEKLQLNPVVQNVNPEAKVSLAIIL